MKLKKCKRFNDPNCAHELTFSCYKNQSFLTKERTRTYFIEAVVQAKEKHNFHLWAYVIMPEHVHMLIYPIYENYSISNILLSIKQSVSRKSLIYLRKHNPDGLKWLATGQKHTPYRFWQDGGGYDRNVISREALIKMVDYIHNNPVRRGLVKNPEDWNWSSIKEWSGNGEGPIPIDIDSFPVI